MIFGQTSFRRILFTRILLVSLPVLLLGVYVTFRKARSAFLEAARQNLTEGAIEKAQNIYQSIELLQANLLNASDSVVLKYGTTEEQQAFLSQLVTNIPMRIRCLQLIDLSNNHVSASTCKEALTLDINPQLWPPEQKQLLTNLKALQVKFIPPSENDLWPIEAQLELLMVAPVYSSDGKLRYALSLQTALVEKDPLVRTSFDGYPVILNQQGGILTHHNPARVGQNFYNEVSPKRLRILINSAIDGKENFIHLALEEEDVELVAGYSAIPSPISQDENQQWIVLDISTLEEALAPLQEIQRVLSGMILGLLVASLLATIYIARELALPLEKLRDYALNKNRLDSKEQIPHNFRIREFNQLALAIKEMLERLQAWGDEIVASWHEAQTANQLKSEFLATTSHELRTPLNGIIGCLQILKEGYCDDPREEKDFMEQADQAAAHLLEIINDILDLARIEAGKLSVTIETVNLTQLLQECINLQMAIIHQKGLQINTPRYLQGVLVKADTGKLKQVLLNVLSNAVKFTDIGTIFTEIAVVKSQQEGLSQEYALVTVKDTGIGIDPAQLNKLFRPFVMVDGSTTRRFSGTGLGLAISRNLMELMGGSICLTSRGRGLGTLVEIYVPLLKTVPITSTVIEGKATISEKSESIAEKI